MRSSKSTGKGLNVKGKSAKKGHLSGLVPFLQISKNEHVKQVCTAPPDSRIQVYFSSDKAREKALIVLERACDILKREYEQAVALKQMWDEDASSFSDAQESDMFQNLCKRMDDPRVLEINVFQPDFYGLDIPEMVLRETYLVQQDITPLPGWETGRNSEPAFQDMNLLALRGSSSPKPVLIQHDKDRPLNPWGLVMAYSEEQVLPVVSDFDPFLFGSAGMKFASVTKEHEDLMMWCLGRAKEVLQQGATSWTSSWLQILKREGEKGFHPEIPKFGFGDSTSCAIVEHLVASTSFCGAVRHGAECFNWYFPQELDDEFLVIWEGFAATDKVPWAYLKERDLRKFLLERISESYSFPLNPAWIVRDEGWYDILLAQQANAVCRESLQSWYPAESGILDMIARIHQEFPSGMSKKQNQAGPIYDADLAELQLRRHLILQKAKKKLRAFLFMHNLRRKTQKSEIEDDQFDMESPAMESVCSQGYALVPLPAISLDFRKWECQC